MNTSPGRRACVIGWPVAHSRSPLIHGYWLKHYGLDGSYGREAVAPEDLAGFLQHLKGLGYVGCNVTLPHKEAAYDLVEVQDRTTRSIRAVNTIYVEGDRLVGLNSDAYGFAAHLRSVLPNWRGHGTSALVLGAGGAARAIVAALLDEGVSHVAIANRTAARGSALAEHFGAKVTALAWSAIPRQLPDCDLVVNTTVLGMAGQPALEIDLEGSAVIRRGRRYRLRTARHRPAQTGQDPRPSGGRRARHAAAPGGSRIRGMVRSEAGGHARIAQRHRGRSCRPVRTNARCWADRIHRHGQVGDWPDVCSPGLSGV
jgi:shikimate dehydrogenase